MSSGLFFLFPLGKDQPMEDLFRDVFESLRQMLETMEKASDLATTQMEGVNDLLAKLGASGWLPQTVLLGPVILQRDYAGPAGNWMPGEALQACLLIPQGIGVVVWDVDF